MPGDSSLIESMKRFSDGERLSAPLPSYLVADHLENQRAEIADVKRVTDYPRFSLALLHFLEDARKIICFKLVQRQVFVWVLTHVPFLLRAVWPALIVLHRYESEALGRCETGNA